MMRAALSKAVLATTAMAAAVAIAMAGQGVSKPKPKSQPTTTGGSSAAAGTLSTVDTTRRTVDAMRQAGREIPGAYLLSTSRKVPVFDGNFQGPTGNYIDMFDTLMNRSPVAALATSIRADLTNAGLTILPTPQELQALQAGRGNTNLNNTDPAAFRTSMAYLGELDAHRHVVNAEISLRNVYGRVDPSELNDYIGAEEALEAGKIYTKAPAHGK